MSVAKRFSNRIVHILSLALIVAGIIATSSSISTPTLSCPGPPPLPLRQLYLASESIVIARVGKSEVIKVEKVADSDTTMSHLKTSLLVSTTLKGDAEPVVYVNHFIYGDYKDELSSAADGVTLLVFLRADTESGNYYVDMNYGLKVLSDADLKVYVSRIEELATLMKSGEPSDVQIVEWLVRCAEEPATRWEGTYELSMSQYFLE